MREICPALRLFSSKRSRFEQARIHAKRRLLKLFFAESLSNVGLTRLTHGLLGCRRQ
jgi:hypothetical protein